MDIYKITNSVNGKIYIGLTTKTAQERFKQHMDLSRRSDYAIHRAMRKYGKENFTVEILERCSSVDELIKRESYWIKFYNSMNPRVGYNMINQEDFRKVYNQEVGDKISKAQKERFALMSDAEKKELYGRTVKCRQGIKKGGISEYVGISKAKLGRYACNTSYMGEVYRKSFLSEIEAAQAYDKVVLYLYGNDAKLNFPDKREEYLQDDLVLYMEWFLTDRAAKGRPARKLYSYNDLIPEVKPEAKKQIKLHNITNVDVVDLQFLYNGKINPDFLLKYSE